MSRCTATIHAKTAGIDLVDNCSTMPLLIIMIIIMIITTFIQKIRILMLCYSQ